MSSLSTEMNDKSIAMYFLYLVAAQGPMLAFFGVNVEDSQTGFLALIFSSDVLLTCNPTEITLWSSEDMLVAESFVLTGGMCQYQDPSSLSMIVLALVEGDIQDINSMPNLCTMESNCYITMTDAFVESPIGLQNQAISTPQIAFFVHQVEVLPLEIQSPVIDLDSGSLIVQANQDFIAVNVSILTVTKDSANYTLQLASPVQYVLEPIADNATIPLATSDIEELKQIVENPPNMTAWEIEFPTGSVQADGGIINNVTQATLLILPDSTNPELESLSLDMNIGILTITFNEIMNSMPTTSLMFLVSTPSIPSQSNYTLDGSNFTISEDLKSFEIVFTDTLFTDIQADEVLAKDISTTYLHLLPTSFFDIGGSTINITNPIPITNLLLETESPTLVSFTMMIDFGILRMTFSEPMNTNSLVLDQIILVVGPQHQITLSNDELVEFTDSNSLLTITLTSATLNLLKVLFFEASSDTLAISLSTNAISDTSHNLIVSIPNSNPLEASSLQPDSMHPSLSTFSVISSPPQQYILNFTFSEYMDISSFHISALTLIFESDSIGTSQYDLSGGTIVPLGFTGLTYELSEDDLALTSLPEFYQIAYYTGNISIIYASDLINDLAGLIIINSLEPTKYQSMETDQINLPVLSAFSLDLDIGTLQLNFSEPVVPLGSPNTVIIASSVSNPVSSLVLNSTSYMNLPRIGLQSFLLTIDANDINTLLANDQIATDISNTFMVIQSTFGIDLSGNNIEVLGIQANEVIVPIIIQSSSSLIQTMTSSIIDTTTTPSVSSTTTLSQSMSSMISTSPASSIDSITSTDITPSLAMSSIFSTSSSSSIQPSMPTTTTTVTTTTVTTVLSSPTTSQSFSSPTPTSSDSIATTSQSFSSPTPTSSNIIATMSSLAPTSSDTIASSLMITTSSSSPSSSSVSSMSSSMSVSTSPSPTPIILSGITMNNTGLDLNAGLLTVEFSDSILLGQVGINGKFYITNEESEYNFTNFDNVSFSNDSSTSIIIVLNNDDLLNIKAQRVNDEWLLGVTQGAVFDTNFLQIAPQSSNFTYFISDTTVPKLILFDLDLDDGKLMVTFDEPIEENSVNVSDIYITSILVNSPFGYNLVESNVEFNGINSFIVYLSSQTLNSIKYDMSIATSGDNTHLYIQGGRLEDYYNNVLSLMGLSISVNILDQDITSPEMVSYRLDLDSGEITLTFSEPINENSINTNGAFIANGPSSDSNYQSIPFTGVLMGTSNTGTEVSFFLFNSVEDIKYVLYDNNNSSYLSIPSTFVTDVSSNFVIAITENNPILAYVVIEDVTKPQALFITPMATTPVDGSITFEFNEYILLSSMNESDFAITISNANFSGFTGGVWSANSNSSVKYQFSDEDLSQESFGSQYIVAVKAGQMSVSYGFNFGTDLGNNYALVPFAPFPYSTTKQDFIAPTLTAFELDTDTGVLVLTFSESVILGSLAQGLQLQNRMFNPTIVYMLTSSDSDEVLYGMSIIIMMSANDTSNLLNVTGFANTIEDTFLQASSQLAIDYSNNSLSIAVGGVVQASSVLTPFTPETPPVLLFSRLDLNTGNLVLFFDKKVIPTATKTEGITLTNDTTSITLNTSSMTSAGENDTVINIQLIGSDLNLIKYSVSISQVPFNVSVISDSIFNDDMIGNVQQSSVVSVIIEDVTSPSVWLFSLDMDSGTLFVTFNEPMNAVTYNTSNVWLSGSVANEPTGYQLMNGQVTDSFNESTVFMVEMTIDSLNAIKTDDSVATTLQNSYLFFSTNAFFDIFNNPLIESTDTLQCTEFVTDSTAPILNSFDLNLNNGEMLFTFNEPVDLAAFDPTNIKVFNSDQSNSVTMDDFILVGNSGYNTVTELTVTSDTLNNLKALIGTSSQAYVSMTDLTISDTFGNLVVPITESNLKVSTDIVQDSTAPSITSFTVGDENDKTFTLVFNEFIQPTSWNGNSLMITLNSSISSNIYSGFSDGIVSGIVSNTITYTISNAKFQPLLSIHYQQAYYSGTIGISFASNLIQDVSGNPIVPLTQPLYYNSNINDPVNPQFVGFDLDLDSSTLVMTFTEQILVDSVKNNIMFQNDASSPSQTFVLTSDTYSSQNGMYGLVISIVMTASDVKSLANNALLASSISDTFLVLNAELGADYSGNRIVSNIVGIQASSYMMLTGPINPTISSFDLDLDSDQLTFNFDTPVDVSTFVSSRVTLVNESSIGVNTYQIQLSNTTVIAQGLQNEFRILLSTSNVVEIKRNPLCYTTDNCYATFSEGVAMSEDNLPSQAINSPLQVSELNQDVTPPRFLSFPVFDLNSGFFTIIFSEPVNGSSTDFTQVQFGNTMTSPVESVTLNEGFTSPDHVELDFHLSNDDLNQIKYHLNLCTEALNCWLRLPSFTLTDIASNPFLHSNYIPSADASYHKPTVFVSDTTAPKLNEVSVDMHLGKIVLSFDEVIDSADFIPSDVIVLNKPSGDFPLTLSNNTEFSVTGNGTRLDLYLTKDDLNWLKSRNLFSSIEDSFVSLVTSMSDVSGNEFDDITTDAAKQATEFIRDSANAKLVSFELFNIDNGSFILSFDEPVNASSFVPTAVTIVSDNPSVYYQLTGGTAMAITNEKTIMIISLTTVDRVAIKLMPGLAETFDNTFIALGNYSIMDSFENSNEEIALTSAVQLSDSDRFVPDTSPSRLLVFDINMNTSMLTLTFDDVIDAETFEPKFLTLQNNTDIIGSTSFTLDDSVLVSDSSNIIRIRIGEEDNMSIKSQLQLAKSTENTYISFTTNIARDIEGRFVIAVPNTNALRVTEYISDSTSPRLLSFNLDLDSGEIIMTFDEPMLLNSFTPSGLSFQNTQDNPTSLYTLQGSEIAGQSQDAAADIILTLKLSPTDLNEVKSNTNLATAKTDSYISVDPSLLSDTSNNNIELVSGMNSAEYVADITLPTLVESSLDMTNGGKLIMKFSEAVQYTTILPTSVRIQNTFSNPTEVIFLQDPSNVVTKTDLHEITITLSNINTNKINNDASIASSTSNAFISITAGGIFDYSQGGVGQSLASKTNKINYICKWLY